MEEDIKEHRFLEYGEHNGHLYGTSLDSIRDVIKQGKMCVLDCNPTALKILHNSSEFMPYVVFIAAPGMETLKHLYYENRPFGASSRNLTVCKLMHILRLHISCLLLHNNYLLFLCCSLIVPVQSDTVHGVQGLWNHWHQFMK